MPWRWAISNNSTIAHSTTSFLGSAGCRRLLIVTDNGHVVLWSKTLHPSDFLKVSLDSSATVCSKLHIFAIRLDRRRLRRWRLLWLIFERLVSRFGWRHGARQSLKGQRRKNARMRCASVLWI